VSPQCKRHKPRASSRVTTADIGLVAAVFAACLVETVEAVTIVLAVGMSRSWRSALTGVAVALAALAVIVAALGPALTVIPIETLRLVVGGLLLIFGLQWLRKAILRASGLKALHDEEALFAAEAAAAEAVGPPTPRGLDAYAFTIAFKGVLLEGIEVAFIVLTFGTNRGRVPLAAAAAVAALVLVVGAAVAVRAPLTRVPENQMKFAVGVLLTAFGMFWGSEGAGISWPGGDAALLGLVPFVLAAGVALTAVLRRANRRPVAVGS
jgi:uncharacterized membrane protein